MDWDTQRLYLVWLSLQISKCSRKLWKRLGTKSSLKRKSCALKRLWLEKGLDVKLNSPIICAIVFSYSATILLWMRNCTSSVWRGFYEYKCIYQYYKNNPILCYSYTCYQCACLSAHWQSVYINIWSWNWVDIAFGHIVITSKSPYSVKKMPLIFFDLNYAETLQAKDQQGPIRSLILGKAGCQS